MSFKDYTLREYRSVRVNETTSWSFVPIPKREQKALNEVTRALALLTGMPKIPSLEHQPRRLALHPDSERAVDISVVMEKGALSLTIVPQVWRCPERRLWSIDAWRGAPKRTLTEMNDWLMEKLQ